MITMMKRAALAAAVVLAAGAAQAACDTAQFVEQCTGKLAEGYSVLNSYALDGETAKANSIVDDNVLTSRMSYQVTICGADENVIEFALNTAAGETVLTNKDGDMLKSSMTFQPERMSVYNLVFSAATPAELCGGAVLGVKR